MLLTEWKIKFTDANSCKNRQTVKWIYYAAKWLTRGLVAKNNDIDNVDWCDEWWLTIKWVIIWEWLDNMMEKSRSNLNKWFDISYTNQDEHRKKVVMNWASVLIEYSPSIFTKSTMPPGAEEFTSALSVYKK